MNWAVGLLLTGSVCLFLAGARTAAPTTSYDTTASYVPTYVVIAFGILSGLLLGGRNTRAALWILFAFLIFFHGWLPFGTLVGWSQVPIDLRAEVLAYTAISLVGFAAIVVGLAMVSSSPKIKPYLAWSRWRRVQQKAMRRASKRQAP